MEQDLSVQVLALREDHVKNPGSEIIRSRKCISCSKDNHIVICGTTAIYVVDVMVSQELRSERDIMSTKMHMTSQLSSLEPFCFTSGLLNTGDSVLKITEEQRQLLISDRTLYAYPTNCNITLSPDCFMSAVLSPVSYISKHRALLAALTRNHRIILYEECHQEWKMMVEMSQLLFQQLCSHLKLPLRIGKTISFDDYVDLCHSMSTVELLWSPLFSSTSSDQDSFYLFFTATKSGSVHVWKIASEAKTIDDIKFVCTCKGSAEVTAMSWHLIDHNTGLLAIGQFDGRVRVLQVTCELDDHSVSVTETFYLPEADLLAVTALDWFKMKSKTIGLLVCKDYFILLYTYEASVLVFSQHHRVQECLPISVLSMHSNHGVICTLDSHMYKIQCDKINGKPNMNVRKIKPLSLPLFTEVEYLSYGMCLSPHGMVCFSVHRPNRNFTKNTKRLVLDTFKVTLAAPFDYKAETVLSSIVPYSQNQKGFSDMQPSIQDILILQKLHLRDIDYADEIFEEVNSIYHELSKSNNVTVTQIIRNLLLYTKQCFLQRGFLSEKEVSWLEDTTDLTTQHLLTRHVRESYSHLPEVPSHTDLIILSSMRLWAENCQLSDRVPEGLIVKMEERFPKITEIQLEKCAICSENLQFESKLYLKCSNGHRLKACCLTFLPCQMRDSRHCNTCNHSAVPKSLIADSILIERPDVCSLCGGQLITKFL